MRLTPLANADYTAEQIALAEQIMSGPRRAQMSKIGLTGPFGVWLRAPKLGGPTQALGAAVRYAGNLAENVKEVAICTVGHFHRARFEFAAHRALALAAGVDGTALERLRNDQDPGFVGAEAIAHEVATALLQAHRIPAPLYARALAEFGEACLVELVVTVGYYCLVSHTLNAFEVPLAAGMDDPYPHAPL